MMFFSAGAPDRLSVSGVTKELAEQLDSNGYFGLAKPSVNRSELYAFAMAIGKGNETRTKLQSPYPGGFILDKSMDSRLQAFVAGSFFMPRRGFFPFPRLT